MTIPICNCRKNSLNGKASNLGKFCHFSSSSISNLFFQVVFAIGLFLISGFDLSISDHSIISTFGLSGTARAEEFIEQVSPADDDFSDNDSGDSSESRSNIDSRSRREKQNATGNSGYPHWTFSIGLGGGTKEFYGSLRAHYNYNRYLVPQLSIAYSDIKLNHLEKSVTELEAPVLLYGANSTLFWPFIGGGPGFVSWTQEDNLGTFDEGNSVIGFYLYGLRLKFTKNFSLVFQNRTTKFFGDTPIKKIVDRGSASEVVVKEDSSVTEFSYNFFISF